MSHRPWLLWARAFGARVIVLVVSSCSVDREFGHASETATVNSLGAAGTSGGSDAGSVITEGASEPDRDSPSLPMDLATVAEGSEDSEDSEDGVIDADAGPPPCSEGGTESCGPPREEGICKFGTRTCTDGAWGECVGGVFARSRDCRSEGDNDCDGQPDNAIDAVCRCPALGSQPCDEHAGLDGRGQCHAGQRECVLGEGNLTSDWGACLGSVGPGAADSCSVASDDANCDGVPNGGCTCVEGAPLSCGPDTENGICQRGTSTCRNSAFGACQGAVSPGRRDCTSVQDNDCDGRADNSIDTTCTCVIGDTRACGAHPDRDGNGPCHAGQQRCEAGAQNVTSAFGACTGAVGPAQRDSCTVLGDDSDCSGTANSGCQCIAGRGNAPCSGDANNSRCSAQGTCAPCQADIDCSLVSGGRALCNGGRCSAARCGDSRVSTGEACDDGNSVDTDACTNACQVGLNLPVVTVQRFSWTSRQAPTVMGPTQGRACLLTRVGGTFNAAADGVQIVAQNGQWVLTGTAEAGGFVEARAACVAASTVTNEVSAEGDQAAVVLGSLTTNVCFFTRVAGNLAGFGEDVVLANANGVWALQVRAVKAGVAGSARCIPMPLSTRFTLPFAEPTPVTLDPRVNGLCYLTRVSGNLEDEGDLVETEWTGSVWELRRASVGPKELQIRAACFGRNDGSGVPAL